MNQTEIEQPTHTPTPWELRPDANHSVSPAGYQVIAIVDGGRIVEIADTGRFGNSLAQSNAEFIVHTVNSHEDLINALERAKRCINGLLARTPVRDVSETLGEIESALSKARGESNV